MSVIHLRKYGSKEPLCGTRGDVRVTMSLRLWRSARRRCLRCLQVMRNPDRVES